MTRDEFVRTVLAVYEVWDVQEEPTPTFEEILEWIKTDRMQSNDYWEFKDRAEKAEAELATYHLSMGSCSRCDQPVYHKGSE